MNLAKKPDFHILAKKMDDGKIDWKYHIHRSEKTARDFAEKIGGEWTVFKLEPVEVGEERQGS